MIGEDVVVTAQSVRRALDTACEDLDVAVRTLPEVDEEQVFASPELLALLLRVVVARRKVAEFESSVSRSAGHRWLGRDGSQD